jgi:NADH dehydrogenase [ubiquinone] 1 alpha subcomplex assembly factor 1
MTLADFTDPEEASRWRSTDDVVMGGRSWSVVRGGDGFGVFAGVVSLEQGGGFASVRRRDQPVDLSACDAVELRVRGDGRRYKLNLRTSGDFDGIVYQAAFETVAGEWQTARLALASFAPRFRGRPAAGTLDPARVCSLGLLISDRQEGPFRLEVAGITAA